MSLPVALFNEANSQSCRWLVTVGVFRQQTKLCLAILAKGHLSKIHRISIASTCQAFEEPDIGAEYIDTKKQRADIMTKSLPIGQWASLWNYFVSLIWSHHEIKFDCLLLCLSGCLLSLAKPWLLLGLDYPGRRLLLHVEWSHHFCHCFKVLGFRFKSILGFWSKHLF